MSSEVLASVFDVQDRVVLVTGGASGLGLAIARVLAECGAIVVIADWNATRLAQAADTHPAGQLLDAWRQQLKPSCVPAISHQRESQPRHRYRQRTD